MEGIFVDRGRKGWSDRLRIGFIAWRRGLGVWLLQILESNCLTGMIKKRWLS